MSISVRFVEELPPGDRRRYDAGGGRPVDVEYGWPDGDAPQVGDRIEPDGSDPLFEEGVWEVMSRSWQITIRGPRTLYLDIARRG